MDDAVGDDPLLVLSFRLIGSYLDTGAMGSGDEDKELSFGRTGEEDEIGGGPIKLSLLGDGWTGFLAEFLDLAPSWPRRGCLPPLSGGNGGSSKSCESSSEAVEASDSGALR